MSRIKQSTAGTLLLATLCSLLIGSLRNGHSLAADPAPVFHEDFSGGPAALSNWKSKNSSLWSVDQNGVLTGHNTTNTFGIGIRSPKFQQKGLRASFRFKMTDAKGVQFKLNYAGGGHIGRFIIQPNGFFFQANKNRPLAISEAKNFTRLDVKITQDAWHDFAIVLHGDEITGTLDGRHSKNYRYKHLDNEIGTFELAIMGKSAMFDDVVITALHGPSDNPKRHRGNKPDNPKQPDRDPAWTRPLHSFLESNCLDCHDEASQEGNLNLASLSTDLTDAEAMRRWVLVFDRVDKGQMPPEDFGELDADEKTTFLESLEQTLKASHASQREVVLRRLNRAEYENTINDLFAINIRLVDMLPADATRHGFDNNGEALSLSAELIEIYLQAANLVLDQAIGPKTQPQRISISKTPRELINDSMYSKWTKLIENEEGTVVFCSGQNSATKLNMFRIPTEGTYRFRIHAKTYQSDGPVMMQAQTGMMMRNGKKRFMGYFSIVPEGTVVEFTDRMSPGESVFPRPFGTIANIMAFKQKGRHEITDYRGAGLLISKVEIEGPLEAWPPASRSLLLGGVDLANGSVDDASEIFARFLPKAFRRPPRDGEVQKYVDQVERLMQSGRTFEDSLRWALRAALCSPEFLFVEEPASDGVIDEFALANRLSYFLWSSMPDEHLIMLASQGKLSDPVILREQTERMLRSKRSQALTVNFAHQWLDLRDIDATSPDTKLYPQFDEYLQQSMVKETELFFQEVLRENESLRSFIDSDWAMLNERLAQHYGIDGVKGSEFRRVNLSAGSVRGGVMTQASVLKVTANGANTSPVTRGVWMLENIMGIHPPPPPPNVPAVVPDVTGASTLRQLLETHRGEESCNSCHRLIDPPGFALEEFDAIGSWRRKYRFQGSNKLLPVDSSGVTPSGERFKGVRDYKNMVVKEIDQVAHGLAEKLMTYATGRGMGFADRDELHAIVNRNRENDYGFRDLIHEIVQSKLFQTP